MGLNSQEWHLRTDHEDFYISTNPSLLDRTFINTVFATEEVFWAQPITNPTELELLLSHSITFGLYSVSPSPSPIPPPATLSSPSSPREQSPTLEAPLSPSDGAPQSHQLRQIGLARLVSDHVTIAYLTDVYILPAYRGKGLAKWLMGCVRETVRRHSMLRTVLLLTQSEGMKDWYGREMEVRDVREGGDGLFVLMRRGRWGLEDGEENGQKR